MWRKVDRFFYTEKVEDVSFLLFYRVALGIFLLLHMLSLGRDFEFFYSSDGLVPSDVQEVFNPSFILSIANLAELLNTIFGIGESSGLSIFVCTYVGCCIFLILGLFTRASAFVLLFLHLSMVKGTPMYSYGVDAFTTIALAYCCVFPLNAIIAVDKKVFRVHRSISATPYRRLLQLHMCVIYFFSGFAKILGFNWWNGESIWKAIHLPFFNFNFQNSFDWLAQYPIVFTAVGWFTILVEIGYPIFVWIDRTRKPWIMMTILLHVGIAVILNLYFFSAIMIILNCAAFGSFMKMKKGGQVQKHGAVAV